MRSIGCVVLAAMAGLYGGWLGWYVLGPLLVWLVTIALRLLNT